MNFPRFFIMLGIAFVAIGLLWPLLQKLGLGKLPGDIVYESDRVKFYFPIMTSIIVSLILSLLFWLFKK
ncbi:MAG: hypothetical protein AMJ55_07345 [Gammaproteobacteria bacterium SG8_15]|nr:MAG: hypothetical protein AMJ55_07345 [Gammaproteobacteria bacterium SG8_15]